MSSLLPLAGTQGIHCLRYGVDRGINIVTALFQLKHDLGDHRDVQSGGNDLVRVRENLARRVAEQHLGVIHHKKTVGNLCDILHRVGHDEDGRAGLLVVAADELKNLVTARRIEARGRLVEHEYVRPHGDNACDSYAALLTAGQLVEKLTEQIVSGQLAAGEKVPPVRELAAQAGVNPNTMQRALAEMEREGLMFTNRTSGRYVTEDREMIGKVREQIAGERITEFLSGMSQLGFTEQDIVALLEKRSGEEKNNG